GSGAARGCAPCTACRRSGPSAWAGSTSAGAGGSPPLPPSRPPSRLHLPLGLESVGGEGHERERDAGPEDPERPARTVVRDHHERERGEEQPPRRLPSKVE